MLAQGRHLLTGLHTDLQHTISRTQPHGQGLPSCCSWSAQSAHVDSLYRTSSSMDCSLPIMSDNDMVCSQDTCWIVPQRLLNPQQLRVDVPHVTKPDVARCPPRRGRVGVRLFRCSESQIFEEGLGSHSLRGSLHHRIVLGFAAGEGDHRLLLSRPHVPRSTCGSSAPSAIAVGVDLYHATFPELRDRPPVLQVVSVDSFHLSPALLPGLEMRRHTSLVACWMSCQS